MNFFFFKSEINNYVKMMTRVSISYNGPQSTKKKGFRVGAHPMKPVSFPSSYSGDGHACFTNASSYKVIQMACSKSKSTA